MLDLGLMNHSNGCDPGAPRSHSNGKGSREFRYGSQPNRQRGRRIPKPKLRMSPLSRLRIFVRSPHPPSSCRRIRTNAPDVAATGNCSAGTFWLSRKRPRQPNSPRRIGHLKRKPTTHRWRNIADALVKTSGLANLVRNLHPLEVPDIDGEIRRTWRDVGESGIDGEG
jgi:hypothetical protein